MAGVNIPFNKPHFTGKESSYISDALERGHLSGNGFYTKQCQTFFENHYGFQKCLLTTSCTDALEMAAILCDFRPGDEIIIPSFTFVSSVNAFILRGATPVFIDSRSDHPGIDEESIGQYITDKTKAILVVHYAGVACDMDVIMSLAEKHGLWVVEDAAQAIDSTYKGKPLGGIGHLSCFSFHETKNISSGEGGLLVINDGNLVERAEIIWEKGTNRAAFWRGEVDKYTWVDIGSSFLPSEIIAAILFAQLKHLEEIQIERKRIWDYYHTNLHEIEEVGILRPVMPQWATQNGHLYYLICNTPEQQRTLLEALKERGVGAVFHYVTLHDSPFARKRYQKVELPNATRFSESLIRLPLYYDLSKREQDYIISSLLEIVNTCS